MTDPIKAAQEALEALEKVAHRSPAAGTLNTIRDGFTALQERVKELEEALTPFAETLSCYTFSEHQLILLSEDNPKGRRLNHLRPEAFKRARAALKGANHD